MAQNASAKQTIKKEWVKNPTFCVFIIQGISAVTEYLNQGNRDALLQCQFPLTDRLVLAFFLGSDTHVVLIELQVRYRM